MTDSIDDLPNAVVEDSSHLSLFWIIPIIAFLIGGWLVYKVYSERGDIITMTFNNAEGIEIKKTPIRYKSVTVGKVTDIKLDHSLNKVLVSAEIIPSMAKHLGPKTQFWTVRPQISVQGVSGLSTLLSGIYIGMDPGEPGDSLGLYEGLDTPPRVTSYSHGKTFTLEASQLGSLGIGSPVYYRQVNVGEVANYKLNKANDSVSITIFIRDPYSQLIRNNTMFWNISGLDINISATGGVNTRMESLTSLLIGGVAFESPKSLSRSSSATKETIFPLFKSKAAAKDNNLGQPLYYVMYFDESLRGLKIGAPVEYRGIQIGKIEDISLIVQDTNNDIKIPVLISLLADKLSLDADIDDAKNKVSNLVKAGMRGQLSTSSLLTGALYIDLVFPENTIAGMIKTDNDIGLGFDYAELPTIASNSSFSQLTERAVGLLDNVQGGVTEVRQLITSVDISKITAGISAGIADARAIINAPEIKASTRDIAKILNDIHILVRRVKPDILKSTHHLTGMLKKTEAIAGNINREVKPISQQLRKTLQNAQAITGNINREIHPLSQELRKILKNTTAITGNINREVRPLSLQLQQTLKRLDTTLVKANSTLTSANTMLNEDSSLQYEIRLLIEEVSEAANSFSVLANTLQRKPNSVIFGK